MKHTYFFNVTLTGNIPMHGTVKATPETVTNAIENLIKANVPVQSSDIYINSITKL